MDIQLSWQILCLKQDHLSFSNRITYEFSIFNNVRVRKVLKGPEKFIIWFNFRTLNLSNFFTIFFHPKIFQKIEYICLVCIKSVRCPVRNAFLRFGYLQRFWHLSFSANHFTIQRSLVNIQFGGYMVMINTCKSHAKTQKHGFLAKNPKRGSKQKLFQNFCAARDLPNNFFHKLKV